ncbi:MAG: DNA polymerase subunit beta [Candidatus Bathyarchaeota archaeon]|jgi:predicted nucleotidyltransferase
MAKRPSKRLEHEEVLYSDQHWKLLKELRSKAIEIMECLQKHSIISIVHGSIARGDISSKSDMDVFVQNPPSSFLTENALENCGFSVSRRLVVQATPSYAMKGYIEMDEQRCVSFPLMKLRSVERDFYKFGGKADLTILKESQRVRGVDKRLMLIEPTSTGHVESTIVGSEQTVVSLLGVSIETVLDRVHALLRRDKVGRTGVFIEKELSADETFEMVLKQLADQNPAVRRRIKLFGK